MYLIEWEQDGKVHQVLSDVWKSVVMEIEKECLDRCLQFTVKVFECDVTIMQKGKNFYSCKSDGVF